jgi:hypothetical protein
MIDLMNDGIIGLRANEQIRMEFETMKLEYFWCVPLAPLPRQAKTVLENL